MRLQMYRMVAFNLGGMSMSLNAHAELFSCVWWFGLIPSFIFMCIACHKPTESPTNEH